MTLRGTVHLGRIELDSGSSLPEGTRVRIQATPRKRGASSRSKAVRGTRKVRSKTAIPGSDPAFRLHELAVKTGIRDLAEQHDHYIYGTPKRPAPRKSKPRRKTA